MGSINWGRMVLGGLLAGVLINLGEMLCGELLFKTQWEAATAALGVTMPSGAGPMTIWILYGLVLGFGGLFIYAGIRPRFGAGVKTAVIAGVVTWLLGCALWSVSLANMGLFPSGLMAQVAVLDLVIVVVATIVGAWAYRES